MNIRLGNGPAAPSISIFAILAAVFGLVVIGAAFGEWANADVGFGSAGVSGVDFPKINSEGIFLLADDTIGMNEGVATLLSAVVAIALLGGAMFPGPAKLALTIASAAFFAIAGAVAITDWINVQSYTDPFFDVGMNVGWGMYVTAIAAVAATGLSVAAAVVASPGGTAARWDDDRNWRDRPAPRGIPRIGVLEGGRRRPDFTVKPGRAVNIGRAANSDIQLRDRHVGHQQLVVAFEHGSWSVRDVGRTNHVRILRPGASPVVLDGHPARPMSSGQLAIGEVVITLFPADDDWGTRT